MFAASFPAVVRHVRRSLGAAVAFTVIQQAGFFASAALISAVFGAAAFGAFGQALALMTILGTAALVRLEVAGQLAVRERRAQELFALAGRTSLAVGAGTTVLALAAVLMLAAPWWLVAGAAAVGPMALVQIGAARAVRRRAVVTAATCRALPALGMLLVQAAAWVLGSPGLALASLPLGVALAAAAIRALPAARTVPPAWPRGRRRRVWRAAFPMVRAEWPALLLNAAANHAQVLLVGAVGGDAWAGTYALAQRISQAPTSLFGITLGDWLRARYIAVPLTAPATRRSAARALLWLALLSVGVHGGVALVTPWVVDAAFPAHGEGLTGLVRVLLLVGALRLAISPWTFVLPLTGRYAQNLAGQVALFAAALGSVAAGLASGTLLQVAWYYAVAAGAVYLLYGRWCLACFGPPATARA